MTRSKKFGSTLLGLSALLVLLGAPCSDAAVLSVSFGGDDGTNYAAYTGIGVLNTTSTVWNTVSAPDGTNPAIPTQNYNLDGDTVSLDFGSYQYMGHQSSATSDLYDGYLYNGTTITLSGLVSGDSYELVLYSGWGWNNANTTFSVNGADFRTLDSGSNTGAFIEGTNYTKYTFTNYGSDTMTINMSGLNPGFNGFELGHTAVPEPSSAALGLLGLGFFLRRRRRC